MLKKIVFVYLLIGMFAAASVAQVITFKDVPLGHPAYDSVYNMVNVYRIMSGYDDYTFRGQEEVTRFQFAGILVGSIAYLEKISGKDLSLPRASQESFSDVPADHWASRSVYAAVNKYQIMGGYKDQTFRGEKPLTRMELATILGKAVFRVEENERYTINPYFEDIDRKHWAFKYVQKLVDMKMIAGEGKFAGEEPVSRYEVAVAMDVFIQKVVSQMRISLPTEVRSSLVYQDIPFTIELGWGGVREEVSQTDNWMLYAAAVELRRPVKILDLNPILDIKLGYNSNKMVYMSTASYLVLTEGRYLVQAVLEFPQSPVTSLLAGLEYLNLSNSFSPSSFLGLAFGGKTRVNFPFGMTPSIKATYAARITRPENVVSRFGDARARVCAEFAQEIILLGMNPCFVYSFEDLMMGEAGDSRYYNSFGLRFRL
jgi:hypothetical protein